MDGGPAQRAPATPGPTGATPRGAVIAITPGLERDIADGRLGAIRTVPVTQRALSRLGAPRGVSARWWATAGPAQRAAVWNDLAEQFSTQATLRAPLAYEFAAEGARYRANLTAVRAAEAYLIETSPRTQRGVVEDLYRGLFADPAARSSGARMTTPAVLRMLQSGWLRTRAQSRLALDGFVNRHGLGWTPEQRDEVVDALRRLAALGLPAPVTDVVAGSRFAPGDRAELGAALDQGLREADRLSRLAEDTGLTVDQVVDVLRVALLRLKSGAASPWAVPTGQGGELPALNRLRPRELQVLVEFGQGRSLKQIAESLGVRTGDVTWLLGIAVEKLRAAGGRGLVTEAAARAEALAAHPTAQPSWWQVRNRLREVEARLDPTERKALWNAADRIEEWLDRLSPPRRAQAYRELLATGIVSVRELATINDAALAAAGVSAKTIAAVRSVLPLDVTSTEALRRWLEQSSEWTEAHLIAALQLLIHDTPLLALGAVPADLPGLLRAAGVGRCRRAPRPRRWGVHAGGGLAGARSPR